MSEERLERLEQVVMALSAKVDLLNKAHHEGLSPEWIKNELRSLEQRTEMLFERLNRL